MFVPGFGLAGTVPADPVATGLVTSLARPGGNVTGLSFGLTIPSALVVRADGIIRRAEAPSGVRP